MEYSQLRNSSGGMNKIVWWHIAGVEVGGGEIYILQSWEKKECVCVCGYILQRVEKESLYRGACLLTSHMLYIT